MEPSIFTKIINGDIPSYKLYEDEHTFVFLDIFPTQPGHTLVVPKAQVDHLQDLDEADYQALMATVRKLMRHLKAKLGTKRVCLKVEGFDVPHAHVHLIPCNSGKEFRAVPPHQTEPDHEALAAMAERVKLV